MTRPLSPKFEQRLRWMETESRFAHACPDLDQELPAPMLFCPYRRCVAPCIECWDWVAPDKLQMRPLYLQRFLDAMKERDMKTKKKGKGKGC